MLSRLTSITVFSLYTAFTVVSISAVDKMMAVVEPGSAPSDTNDYARSPSQSAPELHLVGVVSVGIEQQAVFTIGGGLQVVTLSVGERYGNRLTLVRIDNPDHSSRCRAILADDKFEVAIGFAESLANFQTCDSPMIRPWAGPRNWPSGPPLPLVR
jgi:hypothetical protein